ncbi:hypothetical protein AB0B74_07870 [Micromonospora parva]|uniref:hypothetical protein n=1 Tax=Micromonospora parva TaxID=1464048 RepID=UPI00340069DD
MLMIMLVVRADEQEVLRLTSEDWREHFWLHTRSDDAIEHIRVQAGESAVRVVLFSASVDRGSFAAAVEAICIRVLASMPGSAVWEVSCYPEIPGEPALGDLRSDP